jgi:hypothetical protein
VATTKPKARIVGAPLDLSERALRGATNDEAIEMAYRLLENLSTRAENAADVGIDADDRDVENEALVFATEVTGMIQHWGPERLKRAWHRAHDAKDDLETAMQNRRARLDGNWSRVEEFSHRRKARISSAFAVELARERRERDALLERADITPERVLEAMRNALAGCSEVRAKDVTMALMPELADTSVVGRQTVVNRVSQVMRRLVAEGAVVQHRPNGNDDGRRTCTYAIEEVDA